MENGDIYKYIYIYMILHDLHSSPGGSPALHGEVLQLRHLHVWTTDPDITASQCGVTNIKQQISNIYYITYIYILVTYYKKKVEPPFFSNIAHIITYPNYVHYFCYRILKINISNIV